jgi:hypothetical protein
MANKKGSVREAEIDADFVLLATDIRKSSPLLLSTESILPDYFFESVPTALLSNDLSEFVHV